MRTMHLALAVILAAAMARAAEGPIQQQAETGGVKTAAVAARIEYSLDGGATYAAALPATVEPGQIKRLLEDAHPATRFIFVHSAPTLDAARRAAALTDRRFTQVLDASGPGEVAPAAPASAVPAPVEPSLAGEPSYGSKKTGRTIQPSTAARALGVSRSSARCARTRSMTGAAAGPVPRATAARQRKEDYQHHHEHNYQNSFRHCICPPSHQAAASDAGEELNDAYIPYGVWRQTRFLITTSRAVFHCGHRGHNHPSGTIARAGRTHRLGAPTA